MHWIQKHILRELILNGHAKFSQLKPPRVESNLFQYHLRQLIKERFIEKSGPAYRLSDEGQRFANFYSFETDDLRLQPKILIAVVCYDGGRVLVHKRQREPYINQISLINGKLHFGESIEEAAKRELKEKTGLSAKSLEHAGDTYLRYFKDADIKNHVVSHNFRCRAWSGKPKATGHSQPFWTTIAELKTSAVMPGTVEILESMNKKARFFNEFSFDYF